MDALLLFSLFKISGTLGMLLAHFLVVGCSGWYVVLVFFAVRLSSCPEHGRAFEKIDLEYRPHDPSIFAVRLDSLIRRIRLFVCYGRFGSWGRRCLRSEEPFWDSAVFALPSDWLLSLGLCSHCCFNFIQWRRTRDATIHIHTEGVVWFAAFYWIQRFLVWWEEATLPYGIATLGQ